MPKAILVPILVVSFAIGTPATVTAEPFTLLSFLIGYIGGKVLDAGLDAASDAPDIRTMRAQLDELQYHDQAHESEIVRLRDALQDRMTRAEVQSLLMESLRRVDGRLAEQAERLKRLEDATAVLQGRMGGLDGRVSVVESWVADHERRLRALERVGVFGVAGLNQYRAGQFSTALDSFDTAIGADPTEPGYYFGKALALKGLGHVDEAEDAVKTGVAAERVRSPGKWYRYSMERIQGTDRLWLEDARGNELGRTTEFAVRMTPPVTAPR